MSRAGCVQQLTLGLDQPPVPARAAGAASGISEPTWVGNWQVRSFHGYHQSREGGVGQWKFYISTFGGPQSGRSYCDVLLFGGGVECVPIDPGDRITILGRKYGRSRWSH